MNEAIFSVDIFSRYVDFLLVCALTLVVGFMALAFVAATVEFVRWIKKGNDGN